MKPDSAVLAQIKQSINASGPVAEAMKAALATQTAKENA